jgi:hypothetical protein
MSDDSRRPDDLRRRIIQILDQRPGPSILYWYAPGAVAAGDDEYRDRDLEAERERQREEQTEYFSSVSVQRRLIQ